MPKGVPTGKVMELLRQPNPAVMATVRSDGQPVSVATWYLIEDDGRVLFNLDSERVRLQHLKNDGRIALTAMKDGEWYTHVSIQGHVVEIVDDPDLVDIDRLAEHYNAGPYPTRDRKRVSVRAEIDRWHGWGDAQE